MKLVSVIVPVFNEGESLKLTLDRLLGLSDARADLDWEFIFINDGSSDNSGELLREFCKQFPQCKAIHFSRNFGHQPALTAGLDNAKGQIVCVIDADLQDPPELLLEMIKEIEKGANLAYGQRTERLGDSWFKVHSARLFYRLLSKITETNIPLDTGDFRAMDRLVADSVRQMRENPRFMRGMFAWVGFKAVPVYYQRHARVAGHTKYTFRRMLRFAMDAMFSFSDVPLKIASYSGVVVFSLGCLGIVFILLQYLLFSVPISGSPTILCTVLLLGGFQLLTLGIMGQYIGLIFEQSKNRPLYLISSTNNLAHVSQSLEENSSPASEKSGYIAN